MTCVEWRDGQQWNIESREKLFHKWRHEDSYAKVRNKSFRYQAVFLDNTSTNVTSINTKFYRVIYNEALLILNFCWLIIEVYPKNEDALFIAKNGWPFLWKQVPLFFRWISQSKENRVNSPLPILSFTPRLPCQPVTRLDIQADVQTEMRLVEGRGACTSKASGRSVSRSCWVEWRNVNAN